MKNYHLTKSSGNWALKKEKSQRASKVFKDSNKNEAIKESKKSILDSGGGSLKIHKVKGSIQEERTYPKSDDPRKSKG